MFLLTWKPTNWVWSDRLIAVAQTRRGEQYVLRWSCGNRRNIPTESRVFLVRQGTDRGIIGSGSTTSGSFSAPHWNEDRTDDANYVNVEWDTILDDAEVLPVQTLESANLGVQWDRLQSSGVQVPVQSAERLVQLWNDHLRQIGRGRLFEIGATYSRSDIYRILNVPEVNQGGDWNTGSHQYGDDWYIFASVGASGRTGHNYDNYWDGDELVWRGRTGSRLNQSKTQSQLTPAGVVHVFTREQDRDPFTYEGTALHREAHDDEEGGPVIIRWFFPIRSNQRGVPADFPDVVEIEEADEGRRDQLRSHFRLERRPWIVRRAKRQWLQTDPLLRCACCKLSFVERFGERGRGFIEAHHKKPLGDLGPDERVRTRIQDLAPVCANCHRMLHKQPSITVDDLAAIFSNGI